MKPLKVALGEVVRERRRALSLTQEQLADAAGLHSTYISLIERGMKSPSLDSIEALGRALGVPAHDLVKAAERIRDGE